VYVRNGVIAPPIITPVIPVPVRIAGPSSAELSFHVNVNEFSTSCSPGAPGGVEEKVMLTSSNSPKATIQHMKREKSMKKP
jgi:hypothetical protein